MLVERSGEEVRLHPVGPVDAVVQPPGSKSLTNRYLLCTALADGKSRLRGASLSDDALRMIEGLRRLGILVELLEDASVIDIHGCRGQIPATDAEVDAGHAGTAMRFLTALACLGHGHYRLDGSPRMRERPIGELVGALQQLGAPLGYDRAEGYPPLTMVARGLGGGEVVFKSPPSSQFISALLMVAPYATRDVMIRIDGEVISRPYIDMTIGVMRSLGVEVLASDDADRFVIASTQRYAAREIQIEPDASAATYFWAAAAITGGRVRVTGLTRQALQGDVGFVDVLERMGCQVDAGDDYLGIQGPPSGSLRGVDVDLNAMPDTAQTLAVVALFADGPTRITRVANLRIKETDRLAALESELMRLGARVEMTDENLTITPPAQVTPATIETYDDHRMVMSFALAGLVADGIVIKNVDCVSKSFPDFFETLATLEPAQ
ncbi:MAG: 3-phosphoshikimate 1-carboxyvinyltransferase [Planctomycetes bacterium]|nr:3-phosphoshikimate 1-carboxyvinyltransferase [Planctomycetota bacterium]